MQRVPGLSEGLTTAGNHSPHRLEEIRGVRAKALGEKSRLHTLTNHVDFCKAWRL